jgi:hypothetical protein
VLSLVLAAVVIPAPITDIKVVENKNNIVGS